MYGVEWSPEALDELAVLWVEASPDIRRVINTAVEQLDHDLQLYPFLQSESRGEDDERRVQFCYPLAIRFKVNSQERNVRVSHVRRFRRRGET